MYLIDPYILYIFSAFSCLLLLTLMAYVLYMNEHPSGQMSYEVTHKSMASDPRLLSDWVYVRFNEGEPYLDGDRHFKTVGERERPKFIFDRYDRTGTAVITAMPTRKRATFGIEGQQVSGTLIEAGGESYLNNNTTCLVSADRMLALERIYELTTNDSPLIVVRSIARISRFTGY